MFSLCISEDLLYNSEERKICEAEIMNKKNFASFVAGLAAVVVFGLEAVVLSGMDGVGASVD